MVFGAALLVATASATQDIVIDAFRVESLDEREQAAGMASYVAAYRIGMLVSTAGALYVVSGFEVLGTGKDAAWSLGYVVMAGFVLLGIATTLMATEPERSAEAAVEHAAHAGENPRQARRASRPTARSPNSSTRDAGDRRAGLRRCSTSSATRSPAR